MSISEQNREGTGMQPCVTPERKPYLPFIRVILRLTVMPRLYDTSIIGSLNNQPNAEGQRDLPMLELPEKRTDQHFQKLLVKSI